MTEPVVVRWDRLPPGGLDAGARAALAADVDAGTLARLERYLRAEDRDRGLLGHALLRRMLAPRVGLPPARLVFDRHCAHCDSDRHGKPTLVAAPDRPAPRFNLSHSGRYVIVAVAPAGGPDVGVDVEQVRAVDWESLRRRVFDDAEWSASVTAGDPDAERFAAWARKEAALKASGHGLVLPMRRVVAEPLAAGGWWARLPENAGLVVGLDLRPAADHPAAVALGPLPGRLPDAVGPVDAAPWRAF